MNMKKKPRLMIGKKENSLRSFISNEEFKKQQQDLRRKEDELEKISQVITKKAELLKAEI